MSYQARLLFIALALYLSPLILNADIDTGCDNMVIDYSVDNCYGSDDNGQILIEVKKGVFPLTFKLFDLNGGSYEFIREETVYSNSDILKFDQLKESSYLVQMESGDCSKTIGGLQGIKISRKRQ